MDPNRYAKNRDIRPDGPLLILRSLCVFSLVVIGIIGLAIHVFGGDFSPGFWLSWVQSSVINMLIVAVLLVAALKFHQYISRIATDRQRAASNLPLYGMMLVGVYFVLHLLTTGQW